MGMFRNGANSVWQHVPPYVNTIIYTDASIDQARLYTERFPLIAGLFKTSLTKAELWSNGGNTSRNLRTSE